MHKVLVLGGSGLVGQAIINEMNKNTQFQIYATYFQNQILLNQDRSFKLNLEDVECINGILDIIKPQSVISCLRGDYGKQLILHIEIAKHLKKNGGNLYFCSTTNVFDNDLSKPHYEDDLPNSSTDYGKYKIECENKMIEMLEDNACILRLPQIWGKNSPRMCNLVKSLQNNEEVIVYPKLFQNTNTDEMIARQLCYIIDNNLRGIFHLASEDVVNSKDFYVELITRLGFNNAKIKEAFEEEGYFAILSKRSDEFPEYLRLNNKVVINCLINHR